ncbi:hypothetical protein GALMADRAFT_259265 [Galerina marginata CBS 339.88]|uniref:Uncharacterized protein n=1 Tax=Galerina marginata (strain CBS 339.88) TaxID=685588 RepID=A0A067S977_GALM3|nr:hypothetical protein GALMADRAFT_259265 [Galerina marginata CBS 339.88]
MPVRFPGLVIGIGPALCSASALVPALMAQMPLKAGVTKRILPLFDFCIKRRAFSLVLSTIPYFTMHPSRHPHPYQVPTYYNTMAPSFTILPPEYPSTQAQRPPTHYTSNQHSVPAVNMTAPNKWTGPFKFRKLPKTIQTLIIWYAASAPSWRVVGFTGGRKDVYKTTLSLMLSSKSTFQMAGHALLDVVILSTQDQVNKFLDTVQRDLRKANQDQSRLLDVNPLLTPAVGYARGKVKLLWASECYQPSSGHPGLRARNPAENSIREWSAMYFVFRRAYTLGFCFKALDLLYEVIRASGRVQRDPNGQSKWCMETRALVLAGTPLPGWSWSSITHNLAGQEFLRCIKSLTIWRPDVMTRQASSSLPHSQITPDWVQDVPFESMPNLTHFAFATHPRPQNLARKTLPVIGYTLPGHEGGRYRDWEEAGYPARNVGNTTIFREWARSSQPADHGWTWFVPIEKLDSVTGEVKDENWEMAFLRGFHVNWKPLSTQAAPK